VDRGDVDVDETRELCAELLHGDRGVIVDHSRCLGDAAFVQDGLWMICLPIDGHRDLAQEHCGCSKGQVFHSVPTEIMQDVLSLANAQFNEERKSAADEREELAVAVRGFVDSAFSVDAGEGIVVEERLVFLLVL
jgi:hypothetical protein